MTQKDKIRLVELLTSKYNIDELNELSNLLLKDGCKVEIIVKEDSNYNEFGTVGQIAKKNNVAIGDIGCKNCGATISGAITENKCSCCDKQLI